MAGKGGKCVYAHAGRCEHINNMHNNNKTSSIHHITHGKPKKIASAGNNTGQPTDSHLANIQAITMLEFISSNPYLDLLNYNYH
ncbi:lysine--tRNA ligase [Dorcoceras hygrometricum]|uniref:Lysine--tRNA ligase n=1 Tax=Dorcoceras hygrometricum TaxID=472368 RepID=A0A2Z6ZX07_9LAMI|nr:lysine--tRNA ligase [Dorcoceras hygrometricum]